MTNFDLHTLDTSPEESRPLFAEKTSFDKDELTVVWQGAMLNMLVIIG